MQMRRRLLTVILSAAMVLSMTSPVLAEEGAADNATAVTQETEKIKESGSLDIDTVPSEPIVAQVPETQVSETAEKTHSVTSVSSREDAKEAAAKSDAQTDNNNTKDM